MKITYFDANGVILGKIEYANFEEIIIPSFTNDYQPYLTMQFDSSNNYYWRIANLQVKDNKAEVILDAIPIYPRSIQTIADSVRAEPRRFLKEFSLVEVEFGFFSDILPKDLPLKRNQIYSNALMNGESHKKRPCLVLKTLDSSAQVIPLTSSNKDHARDPNKVEIQMHNVQGINNRYYTDTYALIEKIQTVSYDRMFPLRAADGRFHDKVYTILSADKDAIKAKLAEAYNAGIKSNLESLNNDVAKLTEEKFRLITTNKSLVADNKLLTTDKTHLENLLTKLGASLGCKDLESTINEINKL